jgi:rRNA maturation RNase YbeY
LKRELLRYLAHGILHLLGFDDATVAERERMRELEDKLLSRLGTLDTGHKTQE